MRNFSIKNFLLYENGKPVPFVKTPNTGGTMDPQYLIMHYTGTSSPDGKAARGSISWLCNPDAKASAHLVISEDGSVTQLAPFNVVTWHAGVSKWKNIVGMNKCSIGIEMSNAGPLQKTADGRYVQELNRLPVRSDDVVLAEHRISGGGIKPWQAFPSVQVETALAIAVALQKQFGFVDVLGHEDIAPHRKIDPGPAFPLDKFRSIVFGRKDDSASEQSIGPVEKTTGSLVAEKNIAPKKTVAVVSAAVNIRSGPGTKYPVVATANRGMIFDVLEESGGWTKVASGTRTGFGYIASALVG